MSLFNTVCYQFLKNLSFFTILAAHKRRNVLTKRERHRPLFKWKTINNIQKIYNFKKISCKSLTL